MEVKIGIQYAHRELVLESTQTAEEITAAVTEALTSEAGVLSLVDDKGRRVIVPVAKLAYVEIAGSAARPIGFTAGS